MAITITVDNDRTTIPPNPPFDPLLLDETAGQQTGAPGSGDGDGNEINVTLTAGALGGFATAFNTFLNSAALGLTTAQKEYARDHDGASSTSTFVLVTTTAGETIDDLFFANASGGALVGVQVVGMQTLDGQNVYLWSNGNFGSSGDFCVATTSNVAGAGEVVAAFYLNENTTDHKSAQVQMVVFEPLEHPDETDPDDALNFTDALRVGASGSLSFDFDQLASSSSLWVAVGNSSEAVLVTGSDPDVDNTTGKKTNDSDVIHTSQGGAGATIGVNNQLFDNVGESATFTLVTGMTDLVGSDDGVLSDYVIDNAGGPGIEYGGYIPNVLGAGIFISQDQGSPNATKSLDINVFATNNAGEEEGFGYVYSDGAAKTGDALTDDIAVNVTTVSITDDNGVLVGTWVLGADPDGAGPLQGNGATAGGVQVTITGNNIDVNNFGIQYTISWTTTQPFNRFNVVNEAGKWDIGRVDVDRTIPSLTPVGDKLFVEDDGPAVDLELNGSAELVVDETTLPDSNSILASAYLSTNTADFGTDGEGTDASVYKLLLADDNSGLFDTLTGDEVLLTINLAGTLIIGAVNAGADEVFRIEIDPDTGEVTLTQSRAMINGDPADPDEDDTPLTLPTGLVSVERTITDGDDDSDSDNVDISAIFKFEDDGPALPPATQDVLELITDDTDLTPDSDTLSTDDIFTGAPDFGNDGPNQDDPIEYSLRVVGTDPDSGLVDTATGKAILLKKDGDDVVGIVDEDGSGTINGTEALVAIRWSLSGQNPLDPDTEIVTFTQYRAVVHDDINDPNESTSPETINGGLVFIDQTAIDGDGDVSDVASFDLGAITQLLDDGPAIGPIADGLVDFELNDSVTKTLNGDVGNDPNASPYIVTAFTLNVTAGLVPLQGVLAGDAKSVTYWADTNGDTVFGNAGDTAFYQLTLGQAGAGTYTFTVLVDPPAAVNEFDFTDLPSGQNLFGCIAADKTDLDGLALFVISKTADINDPGDGQFTNSSGTINTSKGGGPVTIGDGNQMYDPGEGAYFVYLANPDDDMVAGVPGGLTQNTADDADTIGFADTHETDSASVEIVQVQGNALATMNIKCFDIDMTPFGAGGVNTDAEARDFAEDPEATDAPVNITGVRVFDGNGLLLESWADTNLDGVYELQSIPGADDHPDVDVDFFETSLGSGIYYAQVSGVDENYTIEFDTETDHDMVLVEGVAGKYDIGGFNILEGLDTPDQLLEFTAKVTDGDGDFASDTWKIGIDGTGIFDDNFVSGIVI